MINAVLVFNNSGQPRLTKFYTQLVRRAHNPSLPLLGS
jgi:Clathrin adaptor complex small chain